MKVVLIIPVLNEEAAIGRVVAGIPPGLVQEIIVVDNGSTDGTARVAREASARVVNAPERGYGIACMTGVAAADDADLYVFMDGDGSDPPHRLADLIGPVVRREASLALGVREGDVEPGSMPGHQRAGNSVFSALIGLLAGRKIRDLPSLKAIEAETLRGLALRERKHGWTAELIIRAAMRRITIVEVETGYRRRIGVSKVSGTLSGSLLAAYRILAAVIRVWVTERWPSTRPSEGVIGAAVGGLLAAAALIAVSVSLLSVDGSTYKILVAVWLWALPVIGVFAFAGYAIGRGVQVLRHSVRNRQ